jgi:hypothetical protein
VIALGVKAGFQASEELLCEAERLLGKGAVRFNGLVN